VPVPSVPLEVLKERFPEEIEDVLYFAGEVTAAIKSGRLVEILRFLKED